MQSSSYPPLPGWKRSCRKAYFLKECLHHNVIPFIIEDAKKILYYRRFAEWKKEKGWLTDTSLDGQDTFVRLLDMLELSYE